MDTIDAHTTSTDRADEEERMTPRNGDMDVEIWRRIDDVDYAHHIVVWMVILELEREDAYPINISTIQRRMFRWWGEPQKEDRVDTSVKRLHEHDMIDREEVDEWPGGKHNTTTADGYEIARQVSLKLLRLLDCEDRKDLHGIDPEAEAASDGGEDEAQEEGGDDASEADE